MKRSIFLITVLVMVVIFTVSVPVSAQDESEIPQLCTAEEFTAILENYDQISDEIELANTVVEAGAGEENQVPKLLVWGQANTAYFSEVYANFPFCTDAWALRDSLTIQLSSRVSLSAMALLYAQKDAAGELDDTLFEAISNLVAAQQERLDITEPALLSILPAIEAQTTMVASWLPLCTEDQAEFTEVIEPLEQTYLDQNEALQTYLEEGTVTNETYVTLINLVTDGMTALKEPSAGCAENYARLQSDLLAFSDALNALTVGQLLPYLSEDENIETLTELSTLFNNVLASYVQPEAATS